MTRKFLFSCTTVLLAVAGILAAASTAVAQNVSVTAASPPSGAQDTVSLVVKITGKNFAPGARSEFFKSGTTDPAGVTVRGTQFVSSTEVDATVDIAATAAITSFDIKVTNASGRSGKGGDLFNVVQKTSQQDCDAGTYKLTPTPIVLATAPGNATCGYGASGALDCTFGSGGLVATAVRPPYGFGVDLAGQQDGKLVALVKAYPPDTTTAYEIYVLRYNADGSVDGAFGSAGLVRVGFTAAADYETGTSIAIQPDGKILAAGFVDQKNPYGRKAAVARLLSNGALDSTFGASGKVLLSFGSEKVDSLVYNVQVQLDGRIIVGGSTNDHFAVARLTSSGALDGSFGTGGKTVLSVGQAPSSVYAIRFQEWGGLQYPILAGPSPTCSNAPPQMAVVRLRPDGTVDNTFGPSGNGRTFIDIGGSADYPNDLAVDANNRIVMAGYSFRHLSVARLLADGTIDQTFGTGGATLVDVAGKNQAQALRVALDSLGRVVLGGYTTPTTGLDWSFLVVRFLGDGTPDVSFGGVGALITDFGVGNGQDWGRGLSIQPSGRIVLAGVATPSYVGLAGFTP